MKKATIQEFYTASNGDQFILFDEPPRKLDSHTMWSIYSIPLQKKVNNGYIAIGRYVPGIGIQVAKRKAEEYSRKNPAPKQQIFLHIQLPKDNYSWDSIEESLKKLYRTTDIMRNKGLLVDRIQHGPGRTLTYVVTPTTDKKWTEPTLRKAVLTHLLNTLDHKVEIPHILYHNNKLLFSTMSYRPT